MLAQRVKEAAQTDFRALAEEAGFRLAHGRTYHCARHRDRTPSAHLYEDAIHCFSCSERYDAIDLARLIIDGSTRDAIRWLASRYGIAQDRPSGGTPRFTETEYTNAEMFRTGLSWAIENELAELKHPLLEGGLINGEQIFRLTTLQAQARLWTPWQLTVFYTKLKSRDPQRVTCWMQDLLEFELALATAISYAGTGKAKRAA